jgi:hypothetical protein
MNIKLLSRVRKHFCCDTVTREANRRLQRKWVASVRFLGSNWLLAKPMELRK